MKHPTDRVAERLFNAPLYMLPDAALAIASQLPERAARDIESARDGAPGARPYRLDDGVATIAIYGELVNRASQLDAWLGLTSYDALKSALRAAEADPLARAILLDVDSPGGAAPGAVETADVVRAVSRTKPVKAFVNGAGASAAYAIAAGAGEIVVAPSATVGSVGVVWLHMDYSRALAEAGVKPTILTAGDFKKDGNFLEPLDPAAAARIRATLAAYYNLLINSVGAHRPALGAAGARDTKAGVFLGQRSVDAGLADRVGDGASVVAALKGAGRRVSARLKASACESFQPVDATSPAERGRGETDLKEKATIYLTTETRESALAFRARCAAILRSDEADGRFATALALALDTDMAAGAAIKVLATLPKAQDKLTGLDRLLAGRAQRQDGAGRGNSEFERGAAAFEAVLGKKH